MKNRQRHEILRDIIATCNRGATLSQITFHAYLAHGQAKMYITELLKLGFIDHEHASRRYHATKKGIAFAEMFERLRELIPIKYRRSHVREENW